MSVKVELHLGDCLRFMADLPDKMFDVCVTDPPYGINIIRGGGRGMDGWRDYGDDTWDKVRPSQEAFEHILRVAKVVVIWGGNYFTDYLPPSSCWFVWDKGQRDFSLADGELAWVNLDKATRIFSYPRAAMQKEGGLHPTQKPLALMKWCIGLVSKAGQTIFDPFLGSGTTGAAAVLLGRSFVGCERKANYHAIATKRIAEAQLQLPLLEVS